MGGAPTLRVLETPTLIGGHIAYPDGDLPGVTDGQPAQSQGGNGAPLPWLGAPCKNNDQHKPTEIGAFARALLPPEQL